LNFITRSDAASRVGEYRRQCPVPEEIQFVAAPRQPFGRGFATTIDLTRRGLRRTVKDEERDPLNGVAVALQVLINGGRRRSRSITRPRTEI